MDDPYLPVLRTLFAKHIEVLAGMRATAETLAEVIGRLDGEEKSAVLHRIAVLQKNHHEEALLEIERSNPALAAILDLRPLDGAADEEGAGPE